MTSKRDPDSSPLPRREALKVFVGLGLTTSLCGCARALTTVQTADQAKETPIDSALPLDLEVIKGHEHPVNGDLLVFAFGDREGQVIKPDDVDPRGSPIFAFPMDAESGHVANESRLNEVILVRLEPTDLSEETAERSALGIVAYSAICTHTGCEVSDWEENTRRLRCPCHESEFDPSNNGRVMEGPAPRRLASLPLEAVDDVLLVAGGFIGPLGAQNP